MRLIFEVLQMSRWPHAQLSFSIFIFIANQVFYFDISSEKLEKWCRSWVQIDNSPRNCQMFFTIYSDLFFLHKRIGNLNFLLPYFEGCRPCPFFCYFGCICCSIFVFCYYCWWPSLHSKSLYISFAVSQSYRTESEMWAGFGLVGSTENDPTLPV